MGCRLKSSQHHQAGGFTGTRGAQHGEELTSGHNEVQVFYDKIFTIVALLHAFEFYERVSIRRISQSRLPVFFIIGRLVLRF